MTIIIDFAPYSERALATDAGPTIFHIWDRPRLDGTMCKSSI